MPTLRFYLTCEKWSTGNGHRLWLCEEGEQPNYDPSEERWSIPMAYKGGNNLPMYGIEAKRVMHVTPLRPGECVELSIKAEAVKVIRKATE